MKVINEEVFNIATAWTLKDIADFYLSNQPKLMGGYIDAKYRDIKITVIVEEVNND